MRRCAFLTMANPEGFYLYDDLAHRPMATFGWSVENIPWTTEGVCWDDYELVVIRSTWDYQNEPERFMRVLEEIDRSKARLENSLTVVRWNIEKTYLKDLQQRGVPIVPTRWLTGLDRSRINDLREELGNDQLVVKPVIGANADDTFRLGSDELEIQKAIETFQDQELMAQPFVKSIQTLGEYSLFFLGGEYSHCVLKTPAVGDFRVQEEHGGIIQTFVPEEDILSVGKQTIATLDFDLLYARVDLVRLESSVAVMELELIEPSLYFINDPASPMRFAEAVEKMC